MDSIVKHFRLVNTEELLGELINTTNDNYSIKNPFIVVDGPSQIVLQKYVPFSEDQTIEIKKIHVITIAELHPEMIRYYYNSIDLGKNQSHLSLRGLEKINDEMEEYIYSSRISPNSICYEDVITHSLANTVH